LGAVRQQKDIEQTTQTQGGTIINKIVNVNFSPKGSANEPVMSYKVENAKKDRKEWVNGRNLKITNNDLEPVNVTIAATFQQNQRWFSIPKPTFKITAGSTVTPNSFLATAAEPDAINNASRLAFFVSTNFSDIDSNDVNAIIIIL
jgi:hypothetical protein